MLTLEIVSFVLDLHSTLPSFLTVKFTYFLPFSKLKNMYFVGEIFRSMYKRHKNLRIKH